jgi:hypothetical protein
MMPDLRLTIEQRKINGAAKVLLLAATAFASRTLTARVALGPRGPEGPPGAGGTPPVEQSFSAATTWNLTHNFNYQFPVVETFVGGNRVFPDVNYALNVATISFPTPTSGVAIARR